MQAAGDKSPNSPHSHRYVIADEEAVETLMRKLEKSSSGRVTREKLMPALQTAMEEYIGADEREARPSSTACSRDTL